VPKEQTNNALKTSSWNNFWDE